MVHSQLVERSGAFDIRRDNLVVYIRPQWSRVTHIKTRSLNGSPTIERQPCCKSVPRHGVRRRIVFEFVGEVGVVIVDLHVGIVGCVAR